MDLRSFLINNNKELQKFTQTGQYKASRNLMQLRYQISYSVDEMAKALNIPFKKYVAYEYGDTNITNEEYMEILTKAKNYVDDFLFLSFDTFNEYVINLEDQEYTENKVNIKEKTSWVKISPLEDLKENNQIPLAA